MELKKNNDECGGLELFKPIGEKDLRKYHPELNDYDEFKNIDSLDLLFVWRFVISYSGIKNERERVKMAIESTYDSKLRKEKRNRLLEMDFPDDIYIAIKKMESFDPSIRLMARYITETTFISYQKILNLVSYEDIKTSFIGADGTTDWGKIAQFVNATVKMNEAIPSLIQKIEAGYGFKQSKKKIKTNTDDVSVENWHKYKTNKTP